MDRRPLPRLAARDTQVLSYEQFLEQSAQTRQLLEQTERMMLALHEHAAQREQLGKSGPQLAGVLREAGFDQIAGLVEHAMETALSLKVGRAGLLPVWQPPAVEDGRAAAAAAKIKKIGASAVKQQDVIARLRDSWAGRVYLAHFKRYAPLRGLIHWLWRTGYPLYVNQIALRLLNRQARKWHTLTPLRAFAAARQLPLHTLAAPAWVDTPAPPVYPAAEQAYLVAPHAGYEFPELYVATIKGATAYGGTNLVLADGQVVCHDLYDFARDYTSEELHGQTVVDPAAQRIRWLFQDAAPESIPAAAIFFDACAPNYAHWITEVLPRVAVFCAAPRFAGVPLAVNDGLHANIMASLRVVAGPEREIIVLPKGRALAVGELHLMSVAGYVPFERRAGKLLNHSHGLFSSRALALLRERVGSDGGQAGWPAKIFLRRNSGARRVTNAFELEKIMLARGFAIIEPETLSFMQQVRLFSNAHTIVASSGAALANMVFAPARAKIFILISKFPDTSYWYWQNMACASGKTINYILGETPAGNAAGIHADFTIDLDKVMRELDDVL